MSKKVLILEDDELTLLTLRKVISQFGYQTLEAFDGVIGYSLFRDKKPDLIIADINMPIMNGREFIAKVRHDDNKTPIIVVSSTAFAGQFIDGHRIDAFLCKPFKIEELQILISQFTS